MSFVGLADNHLISAALLRPEYQRTCTANDCTASNRPEAPSFSRFLLALCNNLKMLLDTVIGSLQFGLLLIIQAAPKVYVYTIYIGVTIYEVSEGTSKFKITETSFKIKTDNSSTQFSPLLRVVLNEQWLYSSLTIWYRLLGRSYFSGK